MNDWQQETQAVADGIRRRVLEHVLDNNGGYMSQACSSAEMFAMLYSRVMKLGKSTAPLEPRRFVGVPGPGVPFFTGADYNGPQGPELDRFIFSPAHYALVLYAALIEVGRLAETGLNHFNEDGSTVEMIGAEHSPGVETTTGSLAQALSQAGGIALARKLRGDTGQVWVMMSDGEFQEGQTWEAVEQIARFELTNLRVIVDANGQQCDGCLDEVETADPLTTRIRAFGASAIESNGHDLDGLDEAMTMDTGKPHFVIARTDPVRGLPLFGERAPLLHYLRFTSPEERAQYAAVYKEMVG
ncbi:MAG: 1-deoxy-D-xylulose-5-phosphate synthase N-terminal domain-containing protein [Acidimicrobiia bacterium]|nr:1-deoxy-D-xylulose-5-phosphate synthase N-terminal domain-containing protein [Acidimicrobiia bacterium]MDX2466125.1 1-deoxy-D-xylulose-5-phosphate synthase N-terminal domain-containing protein [Acidimicrobiia bacterium]